MTAGTSARLSGFGALLAIDGEPLTYRSQADVQRRETGEVITDESQKAILLGNEEDQEIVGIFDNEYESFGENGAGVSTTAPAVLVRTEEIPDAARNDMITRDGTTYYVQAVRPSTEGTTLLILSLHAQ